MKRFFLPYSPSLKNSTHRLWVLFLLIPVLSLLFLTGCGGVEGKAVVVYTSVDQPVAEPVLRRFEKRSGIRVRAVYDLEASKTTGLVSRLISEKKAPRADLFWSSEVIQTISLKEKRLLAPYRSPSAADIPPSFKDGSGCWTGFGLRARILLVNDRLVPAGTAPTTFSDLASSPWGEGKAALAGPLFGTSFTQAAVLYAILGEKRARELYSSLLSNGTRVVSGNSVVRDMVARGAVRVGVTDTDDAAAALSRGNAVRIAPLDMAGRGHLYIPNTVALIRGAPHLQAAAKAADFLLRPATESSLMQEGYFCATVRHPPPDAVKVDWPEAAGAASSVRASLKTLFAR